MLFAQTPGQSSFWQKVGNWFGGEPYDGELPLRSTHTKLLFGAGTVGVADAYLSETTHTGLMLNILAQTDYALDKESDKWHIYQEVEGYGGFPKNPANHSVMYVTGGRFSLGPSWRAFVWRGLSLDLAPLVTLGVQGNLKLNNTNNVTNIKAGFGLDAWTRLRYRLPVERFPMRVQYALRVPVIYAAFAPAFGQSYYEFVAGNDKVTGVTFYPASFHNGFEIEQHLLLDLPIRHVTLTVGMGHRYWTSQVNNLSYRQGSLLGIVGVSFDLFRLSGNRAIRSSFIRNAID